jgi:hypothetical protein
MLTSLFKIDKLLGLGIWSFFSFSIIKFLSIFLYASDHIFLWYVGLYTLLYFIYFFVFKIKFRHNLSYIQYVVSNLLFVILVTLFSFCYYKIVLLDNDYFDWSFYFSISISNFLMGSLMFLVTLIRLR